MEDFNLKKFLVENRLTSNSKIIALDLYTLEYPAKARARIRVASDRINLRKVAELSEELWAKKARVFGDNELGFETEEDRNEAMQAIQKSFDDGINSKEDFLLTN